MPNRKSKIVFSAMILIVFSVIFIQSLSLPKISRQVPESISIIAIVLLILQIVEDLRRQAGPKEEEHEHQKTEWWKNKSFRTGLITVLYVAAINFLGYMVSTLLFMATLMSMLGLRGKLLYILSPAVTITCWVLFAFFFKVNIPHGWLY